ASRSEPPHADTIPSLARLSAGKSARLAHPARTGPGVSVARATPHTRGSKRGWPRRSSRLQSLCSSRTHLLTACPRPPVPQAIAVFALSLAETWRADDEDLEAVRPGLVAPPRTGRDAHRVPFLQLDDLVVDLHPPAPAHDHVHLFLRLVRVAVRKPVAGWDALVGQAGFLELKRLGRCAELQVRRAVEPRADVLE